jgi:transcriptional regulator with XRE-family HTH domain
MNENERAFGKFIEERRKALGITLHGFAAEPDIAPAYMSDIEKGRRYPPGKKLDDIARILKLEGKEKKTCWIWQPLPASKPYHLTCLNTSWRKTSHGSPFGGRRLGTSLMKYGAKLLI